MTVFLQPIPDDLIAGCRSGAYRVSGSLVSEMATGRSAGFLQETAALEPVLEAAMRGARSTAEGVQGPLDAMDVFQSQYVRSRLDATAHSLELVQGLQIGTFAVSGIGLGVAAVGFGIMLRKLRRIESHLGSIEQRIDRITGDRRSDEIRSIFADIEVHLDSVDTLGVRNRQQGAAERAEDGLARAANQLLRRFAQQHEAMKQRPLEVAELHVLMSLGATIRLCHGARIRAMFAIDELEAASMEALKSAERLLEAVRPVSSDELARLCASKAANAAEFEEMRGAAFSAALALVQMMHDCVLAVGSQSEMAEALKQRGVSGPAHLDAIKGAGQEPLMFLPIE